MGVSGESPGDIESSHPAEAFLLLEEKELVGLHQELPSDLTVAVYDQAVHTLLKQFLADSQTCRTCTDNGHSRPVDLPFFLSAVPFSDKHTLKTAVRTEPGDLAYPVHLSDTDTADPAVDEHLAGSALADTALHSTLAVLQTETVYRIPCLMQGGRHCLSLLSCYCSALKIK